jgi:hypothetical protein
VSAKTEEIREVLQKLENYHEKELVNNPKYQEFKKKSISSKEETNSPSSKNPCKDTTTSPGNVVTYWPKGTGFGHSNYQNNWSIASYIANQRERDLRVEEVFHVSSFLKFHRITFSNMILSLNGF